MIYLHFKWGGGYSKSEVDTLLNDYIHKAGGAVMTGKQIFRASTDSYLMVGGGTNSDNGAYIQFNGGDYTSISTAGYVRIISTASGTFKNMILQPNGTWTWNGTACQITSDARLKQQISQIDNALLDAWQDVTPCQFKYNDAVNEKGDNARLHTGYVVQQINEACQKHNIDISEYGLYCHEEYPERTEEVTIENEDGTTSKETKVIEEASEHYSLRYTETLVVECAYLRRENDKLKQQFKQLEETVNELKSIINCSENPNS